MCNKTAVQFERLPTTVRPVHYDLQLLPDLQNWTFDGHVDIHLDITTSTNTIKFNSIDLTYSSVQVWLVDNNGQRTSTSIASTKVDCNDSEEVTTVTLASDIPVGKAILSIDYQGILNDKMKGFYRSKYTDNNGELHHIACTQFEATDCRRALPSWDEPAVKSTFSVTITAAKRYQVISNMPCLSSTELSKQVSVLNKTDNLIEHRFDKTPIMSTYLLAFVIGEFDVTEGKTVDNTIVRCYAPLGKGQQTQFGLDCALKCLPFFSRYFNVDYPLPKADMIAIPDFAAGAMENWGCITYRETAMLVDDMTTSLHNKQMVALTICHELAHQWFGNIVTMDWWDGLWLNEGFASYMEYVAVDHIYPEWEIWKHFVFSDMERAMHLDSLLNTHPIEVDVNSPAEIDEIFDAISYSKGCTVIRMLATHLTQKYMEEGLHLYLSQHKYGNTKTTDLWNALSTVSKQPVQEMMQVWTRESGYPVIALSEPEWDASKKTISFQAQQQRFFLNNQCNQDHADDKSVWIIPVSFAVAGYNGVIMSRQMMNQRQQTLTVQLPDDYSSSSMPAWIKMNPDQSAMFRVNYSSSMLNGLKQAIHNADKGLTSPDRLGIQSDLFHLCQAGYTNMSTVLDFVTAYVNETDYNVWTDLLTNCGNVASLCKVDDVLDHKFTNFMTKLLKKITDAMGFEKKPNEPLNDSLLRSRILIAASHYNHIPTIQTAIYHFTHYLAYHTLASEDEREKYAVFEAKARDLLHPDNRGAVYAMIVTNGGLFGYESMLALYKKSNSAEEKVRCLRALAQAKDTHLIQRTLEMVMDMEQVRLQDVPSVMLAFSTNKNAVELAWQYLQQQWKLIVERFGGMFAISRIVMLPSTFNTVQKADEVEKFFMNHDAPAAERSVKQCVEQIRSNAEWLSREQSNIHQFLLSFEQSQQ